MKLFGIVFFTSFAFFLQCEKGVSDAQNNAAANSNKNVVVNASPRSEPTKPNIVNMNEIFNSKGKKDEIEYQITAKLQKSGKYDGINYPNDNIVIEYELKNTGAKNFILYDRGHSGSTADVVYTEPLADGTVELSMKAFTEPKGKTCPARFVAITPRGTLFSAGETVKDKIYVELPLKTKTPFDDCDPKTEIAPNASKIKFCFGFQEITDASLKVDGDGNIKPFPDLKNQQFLCTDIGELK